MFRQLGKGRKASATVEYITIVSLILAAFFIFQTYIVQGLAGRWKSAGEIYGAGRLFHPANTEQCVFDFVYTNTWYNLICYERNNCDCFSLGFSVPACTACILSCNTPACSS